MKEVTNAIEEKQTSIVTEKKNGKNQQYQKHKETGEINIKYKIRAEPKVLMKV